MKSEMKVKLADIGQDEFIVDDYLDAEFLGLTKKDHLHFITPIDVNASLQRVDDRVVANVRAKGRFASFCYRTFEPVERNWSANFILDFSVDRNTQEIDLAEDIRQEVILNLPMRILSDAEEAKDRKMEKLKKNLEPFDDNKPDTYQPFKNL